MLVGARDDETMKQLRGLIVENKQVGECLPPAGATRYPLHDLFALPAPLDPLAVWLTGALCHPFQALADLKTERHCGSQATVSEQERAVAPAAGRQSPRNVQFSSELSVGRDRSRHVLVAAFYTGARVAQAFARTCGAAPMLPL